LTPVAENSPTTSREHLNVLVVEDDHAGPVESMCQSQDRWVTIRSVSKSLGPGLRLALVAGDEADAGEFAADLARSLTRWAFRAD
jgi:DNA-binding transcriptional MocR family regulator